MQYIYLHVALSDGIDAVRFKNKVFPQNGITENLRVQEEVIKDKLKIILATSKKAKWEKKIGLLSLPK